MSISSNNREYQQIHQNSPPPLPKIIFSLRWRISHTLNKWEVCRSHQNSTFSINLWIYMHKDSRCCNVWFTNQFSCLQFVKSPFLKDWEDFPQDVHNWGHEFILHGFLEKRLDKIWDEFQDGCGDWVQTLNTLHAKQHVTIATSHQTLATEKFSLMRMFS